MFTRKFTYLTPMQKISIAIYMATEDVFVIHCGEHEETASSFAEAEAIAYFFHKEYVGKVFTLLG